MELGYARALVGLERYAEAETSLHRALELNPGDPEALKSLADGNFRIRVPNERTDEIGLATEAFNRTAKALKARAEAMYASRKG